MRMRSMLALGVVALGSLVVGGCASEGTMGSSGAGSASGGGTTTTSSTENIDRIASGSVEDSLNACTARIPKDASAGQQMLAEESCRRDQANRR
jgi:hypothetical protein